MLFQSFSYSKSPLGQESREVTGSSSVEKIQVSVYCWKKDGSRTRLPEHDANIPIWSLQHCSNFHLSFFGLCPSSVTIDGNDCSRWCRSLSLEDPSACPIVLFFQSSFPMIKTGLALHDWKVIYRKRLNFICTVWNSRRREINWVKNAFYLLSNHY